MKNDPKNEKVFAINLPISHNLCKLKEKDKGIVDFI